MADRALLEAQTRTITGKKVKHLRRAGRIPATVYGHAVEPATIDVDARAFRQVHSAAGDTQLVDLVLDGTRARPVLIHSTQIDPRRHTAMHVEFYQANLKEKLTARIPIHIVGESPATRHGLMVLSTLDAVDVECLPTDLPANIEIDISGLNEVGDAIHVRDLALDREVCEVKTAEDDVVVHVVAPHVVEEEEVVEEAAEEGAEGVEAPAAEATAGGSTQDGTES
ncbi:MAG TPA: 50S ribosomal protein L25 [Chloroflexota bacterium]|jgi:large subunit ribosomal protein L25|nr:50S ribosomal protein L25 [Chloroflexota bacterium]